MIVQAAATPISSAASPGSEITRAPGSVLLTRALEAMRKRQLELAWLWADRLCRTSSKSALVHAYMLRSAVFTLQGDRAAAEADLRAAIHIDPDAPAPNRARLASQHASERIAAAKTLLRAAEADNRNEGFAALAREGVACVGLLDLVDGALVAELAWDGSASIELVIRTDVDERRIPVRPADGPRPPGFAHSGRMSVALPLQGAVVTVTSPELKSLFEPASLLLPPRPFAPRQDRSATGYQPLIIVPV